MSAQQQDDVGLFRDRVRLLHKDVHIERLCHQARAQELGCYDKAADAVIPLALAAFCIEKCVFNTPTNIPRMRMYLLSGIFVGFAHSLMDVFDIDKLQAAHENHARNFMRIEDDAVKLRTEAKHTHEIFPDMHTEYNAIFEDNSMQKRAVIHQVPACTRTRIVDHVQIIEDNLMTF